MNTFKKRFLSILLLLPFPFLMGSGQFTVPNWSMNPSGATPLFTISTMQTYQNPPGNTNIYGTQFTFDTVPAGPHTATQLCRYNVAGNTQVHPVWLYNIETSTVLATANIDASLGTPGTFQCVPITPVVLNATFTRYWVASCEYGSGDFYGYATGGNFSWNSGFPFSGEQYGENAPTCVIGPPGDSFSTQWNRVNVGLQ
jgi:hypothetical protein